MSRTEPGGDARRLVAVNGTDAADGTDGTDGTGVAGVADGWDRDVARWVLVRSLLVPMWEVTHAQWGGPVPARPSEGMDRRTAECVRLLSWTRWEVVTGVVIAPDGAEVAHAWNEHDDGGFVDLCGDAVGYPPVQVRSSRPPGYLRRPYSAPDAADACRTRALVWVIDLHRQGDRACWARSGVVLGCPVCGRWEQIADAVFSPGMTRVWCCSVCAVPDGPVSGLGVPGAVYGDGTPVPAGLLRPADATTAVTPRGRTSGVETSGVGTSGIAAGVVTTAGPDGRDGGRDGRRGGGGAVS